MADPHANTDAKLVSSDLDIIHRFADEIAEIGLQGKDPKESVVLISQSTKLRSETGV